MNDNTDTDEGRPPSLGQAISTGIQSALKDVHTMLPGIVESFDLETQRAKISMFYSRELKSGEVIPPSVLLEVPVQFPRWGNFVMTSEPVKGDYCAVFFSERSLELFKEDGEAGRPPNSTRIFDMSDGFAVPGLVPKKSALVDFDSGKMVLRNIENTISIKMSSDGEVVTTNENGSMTLAADGSATVLNGQGSIKLTSAGQAEVNCVKLKMGSPAAEVVTLISDLLQLLSVETVIVNGTPTAFTNAASYTALKAIIDTIKV